MPDVKLTTDELNAALDYIEVVGASDFFPQPFEVNAMQHSWDKLRQMLEGVDLLCYTPRPCFEIIAPKQRCLVRPVHLLDPIDTVFYTGLTFRLAPRIQSKRDKYQKGRVFSWHYQHPSRGTPETFVSDWDAYRAKAADLCNSFQYVATADIVDFFPRVYLHRLRNAVEDLSGDPYGTTALMRLVEEWAHGASYGLPTGPHASNFLAEALLVEVDQYLLSCDVNFIRWNDDYLIFSNTEAACLAGLYQLGSRLNSTQGLSLNTAKTRLRTCKDYKEHVLQESGPAHQLREKIINEVFGGNPYVKVDYEALTEDEKKVIDQLDAEKILNDALQGDIVDLRTVKFVLTVLSAFRRPDLVEPIIKNLPRLLPVADSVARFFDVLGEVNDANHARIGNEILSYLSGDDFIPEFQTLWLLEPFARSSSWNNLMQLRSRARESRNSFGGRQAILGLGQIGDRSSLLDVKSYVDDARDWEQRAILYACRKLPKDERNALISQMGGPGGEWTVHNGLIKAVLKLIKDS